jgi:hypothetical protein
MTKLWHGGYGKWMYYTVAETEEEALQNLKDKYNMNALPITVKRITDVDSHLIIAVKEDELKEEDEEETIKEDELSDDVDSLNRKELIQLAKQAEIPGKIITMSTDELKKQIIEART